MFSYQVGGVPIKVWMKEEDYKKDAEMVAQVENCSLAPFVFHHVSLMPDGHQGYGIPIGGVIALKNAISPNMVGVDIGCGMLAVKTSLNSINIDILKSILSQIRKTIPVGFNHRNEAVQDSEMPEIKISDNIDPEWNYPVLLGCNSEKELRKVNKQYQSAKKQLGTMGGGNHFLEIQQDQNNFIWFMIHSGSRNLGKQIADYYYALAKHFREDFEKELGGITPVEWQIDALPVNSPIGQSYIREMNYALDFALYNRRKMANDVKDILCQSIKQIDFEDEINIHHNYASKEIHFGETVWVHRKGATNASIGTIGIIPGSQGTNSYLVEGLGNTNSYESCSHGAGRLLGRNQAKKNLNLEEQQRILDDQGILHSIRGVKDLDEAPGAYKDIDSVLEQEKDLVAITVKLSPLAVIKG